MKFYYVIGGGHEMMSATRRAQKGDPMELISFAADNSLIQRALKRKRKIFYIANPRRRRKRTKFYHGTTGAIIDD